MQNASDCDIICNMIRIINAKSLYSGLYKAVEFCKKQIKEDIEVVVPDKLSLFMERFLFEKLNLTSSFNIKVNTLNRFAKKNSFISKDKQITKIGSIILIYKILNEHTEEFEILKNKRYSFSYAEEIFNTIAQLKALKISYDEMFRFNSDDEELKKKILDLAKIYQLYEENKAGLLDSSDLFLLSAMTVANGREKKKILFVGFDDFTAIEYTIIERLAKVCEVNVINYFSKDNNQYLYNRQVYDKLKNMAYINELPFDVVDDTDLNGEYNINTMLIDKNRIERTIDFSSNDKNMKSNSNNEQQNLKEFLSKNLFGIKPNKFILNRETVKIYSGRDIREEIEFVARMIRQKIIRGNKFSDSGVAIFDLQGKEEIVEEIFSKYEINFYIDTKFQLNQSIFYKFLLSLLKFNLEGYNLIYLIDLINSPFYVLEFEEKSALIKKLRKIKFRGIDLTNLQFEDNLNTLKNDLQNFINLLVIDRNSNISDLIDILKRANETLHFDVVLNKIAIEKADVKDKIILTKSKELVMNLLDEISRYYPNINLETIYDIYSHIASVVSINNLPQTIDAVKVIEANDCTEIFSDLYLINCRFENAPKLKYDCGIILDKEIEQLHFQNKLSPTIAHINKLKRLELYNTCLMFEKNLTITYSHTASDLIKELTTRLQVKIGEKIIDLPVFSNVNFGKYRALSKWDYLEFLSKYNKKDSYFIDFYSNLKEFSEISDENKKIYNDKLTISASQLENYFKCPFYYFVNNILKIKPDIENDIQSLDVGNILHEILFVYYKKNKQVGDVYEFCKTQIFKIVDQDERLKLNANSPILINLIDEAVRVINGLNYIDQNSLFKPMYFEYEFSGESALHLKDIDLVGKVDRIDCYNDNLRVVDYKSGKAEASLKELFYGNKLQLFLYSVAIENSIKKHTIGGFYLPLHNAYTRDVTNTYSLKGFFENDSEIVHAFDARLQPGDKSDIINVNMNKSYLASRTSGYKELSQDEMDDMKKYAIQVSNNAIEEIKSGYIMPSPSDISKPCDYCPYIHICMRTTNGINYRRSKKILPSSFKKDSV